MSVKNKVRGEKKGFFNTVHVIEKSFIHHAIEWIATVLSITGVLLVNLQNFKGLYIWIVANVLWISFAYKHKHWGLFVLSCSYLVVNTIGLLHWKHFI
jgi:hypothetical protein